jgi:glycolate oxidase FAD binding subunit
MGPTVDMSDSASPERTWTLGGSAPQKVLRPTDAEEVSSVLGEAAARGLGVVPLGALTDPGCEPPRGGFAVLSSEGLAGLEEYTPADLTVSAGAGTLMKDLSATLAEHGQWIPCDPPAMPRRTLGGVVASGASGDLGTSFGSLRDHVLGLTVVTGDGRILRLGGRVMKNVAGFDLVRLMVGSRGTLGVIVSVTLRVFPRPSHDRVLVFRGSSAEALLPLCARLRSAPVLPASAVLGGAWGGDATLVVRIQGPSVAVDADARRIFGDRLGEASSLSATEPEGAAVLHAARDGAFTDELVARASALPDRLAQVLYEARRALPAGAWRADVLSGRVRVGSQPADVPAGQLSDLRRTLEGLGGTLVLQRAPADVVAQVGAFGSGGTATGLSSALRRAFDPGEVLSPGRFVP